MMKNTFIINANTNKAIVYSKHGHNGPLIEVKQFECPECRLRDSELVSDSPGRVSNQSSFRTKGLASNSQSPKEHVIEVFAKEVGDYLDAARKQNLFDELVLVAPPKFLGLLCQKVDKNTEKLIIKTVHKDLVDHVGGDELEASL